MYGQETRMRHIHHIISAFLTLLLLLPSATMLAEKSSKELRAMADKKYNAGQYPEALDDYIRAMEQAEREKDYRNCAACTGYIGNIYDAYGDYNSCAAYYAKGYAPWPNALATAICSLTFLPISLRCTAGWATLRRLIIIIRCLQRRPIRWTKTVGDIIFCMTRLAYSRQKTVFGKL